MVNDTLITASDDCSLKLWLIKDSELVESKRFLEHTHFVMQISLSDKDSNIIATASLDQTVKIWNLNFQKA